MDFSAGTSREELSEEISELDLEELSSTEGLSGISDLESSDLTSSSSWTS